MHVAGEFYQLGVFCELLVAGEFYQLGGFYKLLVRDLISENRSDFEN
jgi:hypothetical protein